MCHEITSVHCWWPVAVNGAIFMRKKVDSLVMWWRSSLVNSINVSSQFPGCCTLSSDQKLSHTVQSRAIVIFLKRRIILLKMLGLKKIQLLGERRTAVRSWMVLFFSKVYKKSSMNCVTFLDWLFIDKERKMWTENMHFYIFQFHSYSKTNFKKAI